MPTPDEVKRAEEKARFFVEDEAAKDLAELAEAACTIPYLLFIIDDLRKAANPAPSIDPAKLLALELKLLTDDLLGWLRRVSEYNYLVLVQSRYASWLYSVTGAEITSLTQKANIFHLYKGAIEQATQAQLTSLKALTVQLSDNKRND